MIPISESNLSIFVHALIQHVGFNMWENSYRRRMEDGDGWRMEMDGGWRLKPWHNKEGDEVRDLRFSPC